MEQYQAANLMGDNAAIRRAFLRYPDMRAMAGHAANRFPDRAFFLCADEKLPYVSGAELYAYCGKAAAAPEECTAALPCPAAR